MRAEKGPKVTNICDEKTLCICLYGRGGIVVVVGETWAKQIEGLPFIEVSVRVCMCMRCLPFSLLYANLPLHAVI